MMLRVAQADELLRDGRRSLLLAGLPQQVALSLERQSSPADQFRSDALALLSLSERGEPQHLTRFMQNCMSLSVSERARSFWAELLSRGVGAPNDRDAGAQPLSAFSREPALRFALPPALHNAGEELFRNAGDFVAFVNEVNWLLTEVNSPTVGLNRLPDPLLSVQGAWQELLGEAKRLGRQTVAALMHVLRATNTSDAIQTAAERTLDRLSALDG